MTLDARQFQEIIIWGIVRCGTDVFFSSCTGSSDEFRIIRDIDVYDPPLLGIGIEYLLLLKPGNDISPGYIDGVNFESGGYYVAPRLPFQFICDVHDEYLSYLIPIPS